jgi:hypothetical protein
MGLMLGQACRSQGLWCSCRTLTHNWTLITERTVLIGRPYLAPITLPHCTPLWACVVPSCSCLDKYALVVCCLSNEYEMAIRVQIYIAVIGRPVRDVSSVMWTTHVREHILTSSARIFVCFLFSALSRSLCCRKSSSRRAAVRFPLGWL